MALTAGQIMMWFGSLASIPAGWTLCDGTLSTPNLLNKFPIGAGDNFAVDQEGGSGNHSHNFSSDGHQHTQTFNNSLQTAANFSDITNFNNDNGTTDTEFSRPPFHALAYIMKT